MSRLRVQQLQTRHPPKHSAGTSKPDLPSWRLAIVPACRTASAPAAAAACARTAPAVACRGWRRKEQGLIKQAAVGKESSIMARQLQHGHTGSSSR